MQTEQSITSDPFPWDVGVYDAHCHPTDTMSAIDDIKGMKAAALTVMATREQDQELVSQVALQYKDSSKDRGQDSETCSDRIIPCFGWHPWFSHQIFDDTNDAQPRDSEYLASIKTEHYKNVLSPSIEDEELLNELPVPFSLLELISRTRERLQRHPHALVGEIGLDKSFRIPKAWSSATGDVEENTASSDPSITPGTRGGRALSPYRVKMEHQRAILRAQLRLAGELQRPVSLHSVQAHGATIEVLQGLWAGHEKKVISNRQRKRSSSAPRAHEGEDISPTTSDEGSPSGRSKDKPKPFPPRICMHSYSGPVDPLSQFFHPKVPLDAYFSFSAVINFPDGSNVKSSSVISALPEDRILVESDIHCAGQRMDDLLEQIVRQVCDVRGWSLEKGTRILAENWKRFIFG
ncbi:Cut9-interacting protein scn1 [Nannizzia gypsea CBS 118893]|uniref:Cut9-interacting protein scn1 n=1 Tax=Arthroderma gypseum (strain ATCC MYA-4604 / CBS 118893) TaxID=535722 RepID=E4UQR7_ARTGP|nr:Cut9-interacting protein scn1 [Nannizzia gypsea CBS 118893]EFR00085.1 Cut9-interacting protein scn1 [Nannizzia gypsea CBS 118893]